MVSDRASALQPLFLEIKTEVRIAFPLCSKIAVRGRGIHPLSTFLPRRATNPAFAGVIGWNFVTFLGDRTGNVVARFNSSVEPLSPRLIAAIEKAAGT